MSFTVRTIYPNLLYQLRIVGQNDSEVELLRYTVATNLLSSSYIPASALAILQTRWNLLTQDLSTNTKTNFAFLLAGLLYVLESGAELSIQYGGNGVINQLVATGPLSLGTTYVINLGIPWSGALWLITPDASPGL